ncbi:MAG: IS1595 family transposase [Alphaproteobacteria bacterium]|nr:IS1595 family transposase [Alphaproteobacteria bacterium]
MASPVLSAAHFHNEEAAFAYVEAQLWPSGPVCPHCGTMGDKIGRLTGKSSRPGLRKCYACRKPFTVRIGTIFEDSHLPLRLWLQAIHLLTASKKGFSTRQLQRTFQCSMKTAWFLTHRIREIMKRGDGLPPLGGDGKFVEADETFTGRKVGTKFARGHGHKNAVVALVERDGQARSFHVPNVRAETLRAVLASQVSRQSHLRTDEWRGYETVGKEFATHRTVNHLQNEYVKGNAYTNTVEGFFSILKRGVYGVYQNISEAHLHRYLAEYDFRYSNREKLGVNDVERATIALRGAKGRRLTYETVGRGRRTEARET